MIWEINSITTLQKMLKLRNTLSGKKIKDQAQILQGTLKEQKLMQSFRGL